MGAAPLAHATAPSRGYEPVTPVDAGGYFINWHGASADGERAIWTTEGSPAGIEPDGGSVGSNLDIAASRRTGSDWVLDWMSASPGLPEFDTAGAQFVQASSDGSKVLFASYENMTRDATMPPFTVSAYVGTSDGVDLISPSTSPIDEVTFHNPAGSGDLSVIAWLTSSQLLPSDTDSKADLYARDDLGHLHQVSIAEDGTDPGAGEVPLLINPANQATAGIVSRDGQRIFFYSGDDLAGDGQGGGVYVRESFAHTIRLAAGFEKIIAVSPGGEYVFVSTDEAFVGSDTNGRTDLYRIDVDSQTAVRLADEQSNVDDQGLYAWSDDGKHVVFPTSAVGDPADTDGTLSLYRWDDGVLTYLSPVTSPDRLADLHGGFTSWAGARPARISRDGTTVAFSTSQALLPGDTDASEDVYVHRNGTLTRISDGSEGGNAEQPAELAGRGFPIFGYAVDPSTVTMGRGMTADGSRVYFSTPESLVPADQNTSWDVYEWSAADGLVLISPGNAGYDAVYADNSSDGEDVFFRTTQPIGGASGGAPMFFDARVGSSGISSGGGGGGVGAPVSQAGGGGSLPAGPGAASTTGGSQGNNPENRPPGKGDDGADGSAGAAKVAGARAIVRRGRAPVRLTVPRAGRVVVELRARIGKRKQHVVARASRRLGEAGRATLRVKLDRAARKALRADGRLRVVVVTEFTPDGADAARRARRALTLAIRGDHR